MTEEVLWHCKQKQQQQKGAQDNSRLSDQQSMEHHSNKSHGTVQGTLLAQNQALDFEQRRQSTIRELHRPICQR